MQYSELFWICHSQRRLIAFFNMEKTSPYRYLRVRASEREVALEKIHHALAQRAEVSFAYVHGSFLSEEPFRDIDVAVWLSGKPPSPLEAELDLEMELNQALRNSLPVDVRLPSQPALRRRVPFMKT